MSALSGKPFTLEFTNARGERVRERPRLMVTTDGQGKALFVGQDTVLASVSAQASDADLWNAARRAVAKH